MKAQQEKVPRSAHAIRWITHDHPLREMAISEDGLVGVVVDMPGSVYVIYPMGQLTPRALPITDGICVSISSDGCFAAVGHRRGSISVWDVAQLLRLLECQHEVNPVNSVSLSASGVCLASASQEGLNTWDISKQVIEARKYATREALRMSIAAHVEETPSQFVLLTGASALPGSQGSSNPEQPVLWAGECIGRELGRAGFGMISIAHGTECDVAIRAFLAELERQGKDGRARLILRVFDERVPSSLPGGLNVEIVKGELQQALAGTETMIVLGGHGSLGKILATTRSEKAAKQVYFVPGTRLGVNEVFGSIRPTNARRLWEEPIDNHEDAELIAAALCRHIAGLDRDTLQRVEAKRQPNRKRLDRALEALKRDNAEEALEELRDPSIAHLDRNEVEDAFRQVMHQYGKEYERVRATQRAGAARTGVMRRMVSRVSQLSEKLSIAPRLAISLMSEKGAGLRMMGLAIAQGLPSPDFLDTAINRVCDAISAFEQYHAMVLSDTLLQYASVEQMERLERCLLEPKNIPIDSRDPSRNNLRKTMFRMMDSYLAKAPDYLTRTLEASSNVKYHDDPKATHGRFVVTRGTHEIENMGSFQMGTYPVTNRLFHRFVRSDQYSLHGPGSGTKSEPEPWTLEKNYPLGTGEHPVSGISYLDALAFVKWLNAKSMNSEWRWVLPTEDMWELAARSPSGFNYPWGNSFGKGKCNSIEATLNGPSEVGRFPDGQSWAGCFDMAGNVWEFVAQQPGSKTCVLRGGSYKNNRDAVKNCFRLQAVSVNLRAADFGFRCAKVRVSTSGSHSVPQATVQRIENRVHEIQHSQSRPIRKAVKKSQRAQKQKAPPKKK